MLFDIDSPVAIKETQASYGNVFALSRRRYLNTNAGITRSMPKKAAARIYIVIATKDGVIEYWAAATRRKDTMAAVSERLPPGWQAVLTSWRLTPEKMATLNLRPNNVCQLSRQGLQPLIRST